MWTSAFGLGPWIISVQPDDFSAQPVLTDILFLVLACTLSYHSAGMLTGDAWITQGAMVTLLLLLLLVLLT